MLLRFGVANFRSIRDPVDVSFLASSQSDAPAWRMPSPSARYGVLPAVGVFGGNASGKSNLLRALTTLGDLVRDSAARVGPGTPLPWTPFRLDTAPGARPTQLDVDFLLDGVHHHYGFSYSARGIHEEWLHRWPGRSRQRLFHRSASPGRAPWTFGPALGGARRLVAESTRPNALFVSTGALLNHEQLGAVAREIGRLTLRADPLPTEEPTFSRADRSSRRTTDRWWRRCCARPISGSRASKSGRTRSGARLSRPSSSVPPRRASTHRPGPMIA